MSRSQQPQVVWLNGSFLPVHQAAISPLDRGFLYGDGLFETMRSENGSVLYFDDHLKRLSRSMTALRLSAELPRKWDDLLKELLRKNELYEETATVKIIVTRGTCTGLGLPSPSLPTICLTAQRYIPPSLESYRDGWRLISFRTGFSPSLSTHKTLNYLYFLTARQAALDAGADEALILDPQGNVSEASACSLIARTKGKWWSPAGHYQLPGITLGHISRILNEAGQQVDRRMAGLSNLWAAETVWLLNSLMGIMPVSGIDGTQLPDPAAEEAAIFRKKLFEQGKKDKTTESLSNIAF